jgi:hypothetical protein
VKIKLVHDLCGREVLVPQILDNEGHCPWDGKPFTRDYTANLVEALQASEIAGSALEAALDRVAGFEPSFVIEATTVLGPIQKQLSRLGAAREAAGA